MPYRSAKAFSRIKNPAWMAVFCHRLQTILLFCLPLLPVFAPLFLLCALALSKKNSLGFHAILFFQALSLLCCLLEAHLLKRLFQKAQSGALCTLPAARSCGLLCPGCIGQSLALALHAPLWPPLALLCCLFLLGGLAAAVFCCLLLSGAPGDSASPQRCGAARPNRHKSARKARYHQTEVLMKSPKLLAKTICIILYLTLTALLAAFFFIPGVARSLALYGFRPYWAALIFLYLGWACAAFMSLEFVRIMSTVQKGTPFLYQNVRSLRHIAICCGVCALDMFFMLCFNPSITLGICAAILCFGCLCALVLGSVFGNAVLYKEENDLTI